MRRFRQPAGQPEPQGVGRAGGQTAVSHVGEHVQPAHPGELGQGPVERHVGEQPAGEQQSDRPIRFPDLPPDPAGEALPGLRLQRGGHVLAGGSGDQVLDGPPPEGPAQLEGSRVPAEEFAEPPPEALGIPAGREPGHLALVPLAESQGHGHRTVEQGQAAGRGQFDGGVKGSIRASDRGRAAVSVRIAGDHQRAVPAGAEQGRECVSLVVVDGDRRRRRAAGPGEARRHRHQSGQALHPPQDGEPGEPALPAHGDPAGPPQGIPVGVAAGVQGPADPLWPPSPASRQGQMGRAEVPGPGPAQASLQGARREPGDSLAAGGPFLGQGEHQAPAGDQGHTRVVAVPEAQDRGRLPGQISSRMSGAPRAQVAAWEAKMLLQVLRSPPSRS